MFTYKIKSIKPLHDYVIVRDMNFAHRTTSSGVLLPSDDMKSRGVRPRWAQVYAIGHEQTDVKVGQWICVAHGRWTRGLDIETEDGERITIRRVDNNDILLVSDEELVDDIQGEF